MTRRIVIDGLILTCIHADLGLCEHCQAEYDENPAEYLEYGDHPAGIERWRELTAEIAADRARESTIPPNPDIPF